MARGGLRWSDRREDFRTEVLGLVKAQMVKNAIIVPVGAKGGFVVKQGNPADRDTWQKQGIACYKQFIRGLLDITDNREGETVVPPPGVVRHDKDDPYLVVAASLRWLSLQEGSKRFSNNCTNNRAITAWSASNCSI